MDETHNIMCRGSSDPDDVLIEFSGQSGSILLNEQYRSDAGIELLVFADGTAMTEAQIFALLSSGGASGSAATFAGEPFGFVLPASLYNAAIREGEFADAASGDYSSHQMMLGASSGLPGTDLSDAAGDRSQLMLQWIDEFSDRWVVRPGAQQWQYHPPVDFFAS